MNDAHGFVDLFCRLWRGNLRLKLLNSVAVICLTAICPALKQGAIEAQEASDQPYELKGEMPGISMKQFKANHRHPDCFNSSARQTSCHIRDGVSFAGMTAQTFTGCTDALCTSQGIFADFFDGRLVSLSYGVRCGGQGDCLQIIIRALKQKYGEPTTETKSSAAWKNRVGTLKVSELDGDISITSTLTENPTTKDI
jgi:hypothetical protein